jgi:glycosyltransferase involved in cell wall biosynthesis
VLWSRVLRLLTSARIIWVATRPDLASVPALLRRRRTAHVIVGNSARPEMLECAEGADFVQQFIGIDPRRLGDAQPGGALWSGLGGGIPTALHVGHLRRSRGLDLLAEAQRLVGPAARILVLGSPTFPPDDGVVEELEASGVTVRREYVDNLASLYKAVDLYLFPVRSEAAGAIDLPLGVLEAVACGTPVVSTPFGSLPEALADVEGVHFVEPEQNADAVARLVTSPTSDRPPGLPLNLHANRVTGAVLTAMVEVAS